VIKILFVGDIVGKPGRKITQQSIPRLIELHKIDLVIANVENAAGGNGITRETAEELLDADINVMTTGNHVWDKKEALEYIELERRLIRPANFPHGVPGRGSYVTQTANGTPVGIVNVMGRVFMNPLDNPFHVVQREISAVRDKGARLVLVDFHAEATSEKIAMGWHLDGKVTAVVGTHTHVQTADARILHKGTAYITDVGMTGPHDSIIGVAIQPVLKRFIDGMPVRFETASKNSRINAVIVTADAKTGRAESIESLNLSAEDIEKFNQMSESIQ
jgi:metallophosphoesterase (TIGR00282 family)